MPTNQTDIERIKQSFRECAELAIFHRNRKGGEDTPVSLSPYDVTTLLADHDLKAEQLRAAIDAGKALYDNMGGHNHWDRSGRSGLGCYACQQQIKGREAWIRFRNANPELFSADGAETERRKR